MSKVLIARTLRPEGIRGLVKIYSCVDSWMSTLPLSVNDGSYTILKVYKRSKGLFAIAMENVKTRCDAEKVSKIDLYVDSDTECIVEKPVYQSVQHIKQGCMVFDSMGEKIGFVKGMYNFGAGDIIELDNDKMLPFTNNISVYDDKIVLSEYEESFLRL